MHASRLLSQLALAILSMVIWSITAAEINSTSMSFRVLSENGAYEMVDKSAGIGWRSNPFESRFGEVSFVMSGKSERFALRSPSVRVSGNELTLTFQPLTNKTDKIEVKVQISQNGAALDFSYTADATFNVESIRLLDNALWATDSGQGYVVLPVRQGLLVPADSGVGFSQRFDTYAYEGCHMEMFGVVQNGAAALITWNDPYAAVELRSVLTNLPSGMANKQGLFPSLLLRKTAKSFRVQLLGKGDYVTISKAYRSVAKEKGLLVTWDEKLQGYPERAKYLGASNYKLWSTLDRRMNEDSAREEHVRVNWTFDEAAQVAEHLKNDLKLDKVLFIMGGWIHRGYDNQHPDILPTAPECGGDAAFREACRRILNLGYILSLHDNYQDIYRDSPSWDERYIQKNVNGSLVKGGHWAGGFAYITCSKMAFELAQRPQNLRAVKKLSNADSYFIDTTYAAGLQECFDSDHPLTRADDIKWKSAISDYARDVFGSFGSECGREWAIPHADFFEGLSGVSGGYYHDKALPASLGARVVPLFELVYRDCIAIYGKYGYDPAKAAEYVLHHIAIGRPLNYHIIPPHLYWKDSNETRNSTNSTALFTRADHGWAEGRHIVDRFVKNTHEILSPLNEITARGPMTDHKFLNADRTIQQSVFGSGDKAAVVTVNLDPKEFSVRSKFGGNVALPQYGFLIESPTFIAFVATTWNGQKYKTPTLFTLRSADGNPLAQSKQIHVFHGFGDTVLRNRDKVETVKTERTIETLFDAGQ